MKVKPLTVDDYTNIRPLTVGDDFVIPLTVGDGNVRPLTVGDDYTNIRPLTTGDDYENVWRKPQER